VIHDAIRRFIMRTALTGLLTAVMVSLSWGVTSPLSAQNPASIWTGVYTPAQAERGRVVYEHHCSECHGSDMTGGEGPALSGSTFMIKWETHSVERLFHKVRDTMPSVGSTDVTESEKLDAVAYILQQNGFPHGTSELTEKSPAFTSLRIVPKGGATLPRAGALVQAVGCIQEGAANQWVLAQSTDPQVTTLDALSEAEKESAAAAAAGTQTIQLLSAFPSPSTLKGQKALAKGLLIKAASGLRINVMRLEPLSADCGK
jgi:mono/diheme cytochrome c family protein